MPASCPAAESSIPPNNAPIVNSQRGYARGVQVFVQRRTTNGFTGWISYAYGHAQMRDGDLRLSFPPEVDQRHTVTVFGSYRLRPTVNLSLRWIYGSGFPIPGFYRAAPGGYFLAPAATALAYPPISVRTCASTKLLCTTNGS